jgi:hypothetical protein
MRLHLAEKSSLKRPFILGGVVVGALASAWYLYRNVALQSIPGRVPDPVWSRFVNVALIMFVAIYVANLLRRVVEFMLTKKERS